MEEKAMNWNPELYDSKLGIVSEFGRGLVDWLAPVQGERILDLGCGTGDLAFQLAGCGALVTGMDASVSMIETARRKYPELRFEVGDGQCFDTGMEKYDAVFSNAALHWMMDAAGAAESVRNALKPGGRFVAEFGGRGNVRNVVEAVQLVLSKHYGWEPGQESGPWYFPSIGEYSALLEKTGFRVTRAALFQRPTPMKDGPNGLRHWLDSFGEPMLQSVPAGDREQIIEQIHDHLKKKLYQNGVWTIDYVRLRIEAWRID